MSPDLRADLARAIKELVLEFDRPEHTNIDARPGDLRGLHEGVVQPYRVFFSREQDPEKGLVRILSISWIGGKPFSEGDIPAWKALVEEAIGQKLVQCSFAFADHRRIYCLW